MPGGIRLKLNIIIRPCYRDDKKPGFPICIYYKKKPIVVISRHKTKSNARQWARFLRGTGKLKKRSRNG